jgi:RHS repeat-associated protein
MFAIAQKVRHLWNKRTKLRRRKAERKLFLESLERREVFAALPVGIDDLTYSTAVSTTLNVSSGSGVLANDFQVDGNSLTATQITGPSHGSLSSFNSNGSFAYVPTTGYIGLDSFTYRVDSGSDQGNIVTVSIAVGTKISARTNADNLSQNGTLLDGANVITQSLGKDLNLIYRSDTSLIKPIIAVETTLLSGASVPDSMKAELTFNGVSQGVVTYTNSGLTAGTPLRFALTANGTGLSTGMYSWSMKITATYSGVDKDVTFTGQQAIINRSSSEFGDGWWLDGLDRLYTSGSGALLVKGNGDVLWFTSNGAGGYNAAAGDKNFSTLTYASSVYTLTDKYGNQEFFDSSGYLTSIEDSNNTATTFTYTSGRLTSITDPFSRSTTLAYASNKLDTMTDIASRVTDVTISSGKLTQVDLPDPDAGGALTSPQWKYTYDGTTGLLNKQTDARNNDKTYSYNSTSARLETITFPGGSTYQLRAHLPFGVKSGTGNTVVKIDDVKPYYTDQRGYTWYFQLDRFGNVRQTNDYYGAINTSYLDANGLLYKLEAADPDGIGALTSSTTKFGYNASGDQIKAINADGTTRSYTYDSSLHRMLTETDELGRVTTMTINAYGNVLTKTNNAGKTWTYTYNGLGQILTETTPDPDGAGGLVALVTSYAYDSNGRLVTLTNPDSSTKTYTYTTSDQIATVTDELSHVTTYAYDNLDRLTSVTGADPDGGGALTSPVTSYQYDANGNRTKVTDALSNATDYTYDARNHLTQEQGADPDGAGSLARLTTSYTVDVMGYVTGRVDAFSPSATTVKNYDAYGRLLSTELKVGSSTLWSNSVEFDKLGRKTKHTDKLGRVETWDYDNRDRVTKFIDNKPAFGAAPETTYTYDAASQLLSSTDFRGYTTSYAYDSIGQLTKKTLPDPDGAGSNYSGIIQYGYDYIGRQTTVTDPLGRVTTTAYNSRGWVSSVTRPDPDGAGGASAPVTSYTYLNNGLLSTVTDPLSRVTTYAYDNLDRKTSVTDPDPDAGGALTAPVTSWTYDALGNVLTTTDPLSHVTTFAYDNIYRQKTVTLADPDGAGALTSPVTTYIYNANGLLDTVTDSMGHNTTYGYDSRARRTTVTDNAGNVTTTAYNDKDQVTSVTTPDPDGAGAVTASVTSYTYDIFGRTKTVTDALSGVSTTNYDVMGNITSIQDSGSNTTTWTYDGLGREITETNQLSKTRYTFYDMAGNVARVINRNGKAIQNTYDDLDRLLTEKWYDSASTAPTSNTATTVDGSSTGTNEVQRVGYSTNGSIGGGTFTLTYNGQTTSGIAHNSSASVVKTALEALSNIGVGDVAVTQISSNSSSPLWEVTFQGALAQTNVSQITVGTGSLLASPAASASASTVTQGLPTGNEVQTVTVANATGGTFRLAYNNGQTVAIAYNASTSTVQTALEAVLGSGNVTVSGSAGNYTVTFTGIYASTNVAQLGSDASQLQSGTLNRTLTYAYDAASQLTSADDPAANYTYTYDNLGRVTSTTQTIAGLTPTVTYANTYDAASNRTQLATTLGSTADFKNTYTFDNLNRLTTVKQESQSGGNTLATKLVDFAYNKLNQFTQIDRYQNTGRTNKAAQTAYSYDTDNRLSGLAHTQSSTNLGTYAYTYDNASRFTQIAYTNTTSAWNSSDDFTHNKTNQLTGADYDNQTDDTFTYDANGNRTARNGTSTTVSTNNRITNDGTYTYTYDDEGNRLTKTAISGGAKEEYTWDHRNRLTGVTYKNSGGTVLKTVTYAYDVNNELVRRTYDADGPGAGAAVDRFFSNLDHQVQIQLEGAAASSLSHRYLWGPRTDQLLADENVSSLSVAGNILWALSDHQGTTKDIADQNESTYVTTVTNHRVFNAFGALVSETNSGVSESFAYTGRMRDDVTGLQNNLNRWYDANLGQWMSEDPIGFAAGDTNLRRYVLNSVLSLTDPTGLAPPNVDDFGSFSYDPDKPRIDWTPFVSPPEIPFGSNSYLTGNLGVSLEPPNSIGLTGNTHVQIGSVGVDLDGGVTSGGPSTWSNKIGYSPTGEASKSPTLVFENTLDGDGAHQHVGISSSGSAFNYNLDGRNGPDGPSARVDIGKCWYLSSDGSVAIYGGVSSQFGKHKPIYIASIGACVFVGDITFFLKGNHRFSSGLSDPPTTTFNTGFKLGESTVDFGYEPETGTASVSVELYKARF